MSAPILVLGDVMTDVVALAEATPVRGSDVAAHVSTRGGGSAANLAAWLAVSGRPVTMIARVGADAWGDAAIDDLRSAGVTTRIARDPEGSTGTCIVLVEPDGERTMLPDPGANNRLVPADLPLDLFARGAHLHVSGYSLLRDGSRPAALLALATAREAGMTVSVDMSSAAPLALVGADRFLAWAGPADVGFANHDEATALTGQADATLAARALAARFALAVVKVGEQGAVAADETGGTWSAPAAGTTGESIDTTGAGDAFAAGFLAAWTLGAPPGEALEQGATLAGRAVATVGGRP